VRSATRSPGFRPDRGWEARRTKSCRLAWSPHDAGTSRCGRRAPVAVVRSGTVEESGARRRDPEARDRLVLGDKALLTIGTAEGDGRQTGHEISTAVVAHLQNERHVLGQSRRDVFADHVGGLIAALRRQQCRRIGSCRSGGHAHPCSLQRLNQRSPREGGGIVNFGHDERGEAPGLAHHGGQLVERGEGIALGLHGVGQADVRIAVVELRKVLVGQRAVRLFSQPEREIAGADENQVPVQGARADGSFAMDGCPEPVVRPYSCRAVMVE